MRTGLMATFSIALLGPTAGQPTAEEAFGVGLPALTVTLPPCRYSI